MLKFSNEKKINSINKILSIILLALFAVLLFMTISAFISVKTKSKNNLQNSKPSFEVSESKDDTLKVFAGLGRIRCSLKPEGDTDVRCPVVISPWFNYDKNDIQFYEELSKKAPLFKSLISSYFANGTKTHFQKIGEEQVKKEILSILNEHLVLGKIDELFFSEYIFLF